MRRFHAPSAAVLVVAQSIRDELSAARLQQPGAVVARRRHRRLPPASAQARPGDPRPIWLYAGRVAIEKNIKAFLDLDLPGTKWVVGGGPQLKELKRRYKDVQLLRLGRHRGAVAALRRGRLLRLPQPHRHVRPGHGRGAGLGRAGRGLSRARPARCRDRCRKSARSTRTCAPPASPPSTAIPADCRRHAETFTWASCAAQFLATLRPIPRGVWQPLRRRVAARRGGVIETGRRGGTAAARRR